MSKITAIVKKPNEKPEVKELEDALETWQGIVNGYIEIVPLTRDTSILIVCNEEGKLKGLQENMKYGEDILVGTIAFVGNEAPEFRSLTKSEIELVMKVVDKGGL